MADKNTLLNETCAWTSEASDDLQRAVDTIFSEAKITGLQFAFTVADPSLEGCPLVGCSTGFSEMCGYDMDEIIGRNCRFLLDPVPAELVDPKQRQWARDYCEAVRNDLEYEVPDDELEPWMILPSTGVKGLFCAQTNAKKDGTLFKNMFYLKRVYCNDKPFIVGLQSNLGYGENVLMDCQKASRVLAANMAEVERICSSLCWINADMRRQESKDHNDGFVSAAPTMEVLPPMR